MLVLKKQHKIMVFQWPKNCCLLEELLEHLRALSICETAEIGTVPDGPDSSGG